MSLGGGVYDILGGLGGVSWMHCVKSVISRVHMFSLRTERTPAAGYNLHVSFPSRFRFDWPVYVDTVRCIVETLEDQRILPYVNM